jgi:hypothetical protein
VSVHARPAARAIVRCKLVKVLAGAAMLALSVYTELAFAEGKSVLAALRWSDLRCVAVLPLSGYVH